MRLGRPLLLPRLGAPPGAVLALSLLVGVVTLATSAAIVIRHGDRLARVTISSSAPAGVAPSSGELSPPDVDLLPASVPQGGAFTIRLRSTEVVAASVHFDQRDYPMIHAGDRWVAIAGAGQPVGSAVMLPAASYPVDVTYQSQGSSNTSTTHLTLTVTATDFPVDAIEVSDDVVGLLDPQLEAVEAQILTAAYSTFSPVQLWQGAFAMPVNGPITTVFGARRSYQGGPATGSHAGIDIAVDMGTPVRASAAGRIVWTGPLPDRGNGVIVDHGLGVFTGYFHLSQILGEPGQSVDKGDTVGLAGSTGLSTGPHVHWEVVIAQTNVDGLLFVQREFP